MLRLYNLNWYSSSDTAVLRELGRSLRQMRLNRNQSQRAVADATGIDRATPSLIEHGRPTSLFTFVQLLRVLEQLDFLNGLTTTAGVTPVALARLTARQRRHASPAPPDSATSSPAAEW
ncbi:helix-turn-helix domain-containing protein [Hymenobacter defluvii]|uniref:Helix-turn-helix transcriptional regulator n=1 Tax=Hymenobacter defluvii TaxID=2054411 RepID=A0ABS3TEW5_9BACT|nr:helix-turn-helix transcriptional regulator [Hymenobacter defluvii]MBO3272196.1 helix-turn-helix transcriptional regulator [Hymenobacter defluvii]